MNTADCHWVGQSRRRAWSQAARPQRRGREDEKKEKKEEGGRKGTSLDLADGGGRRRREEEEDEGGRRRRKRRRRRKGGKEGGREGFAARLSLTPAGTPVKPSSERWAYAENAQMPDSGRAQPRQAFRRLMEILCLKPPKTCRAHIHTRMHTYIHAHIHTCGIDCNVFNRTSRTWPPGHLLHYRLQRRVTARRIATAEQGLHHSKLTA